MTVVAHSRTTSASPSKVWAVLAEYASLADWAPVITHSSAMTDAAGGVDAVRRVAIGSTVLLERVVEWEPEGSLAYAIEGLPPLIASAVNRWTLSAVGESTMVTLTATVEPGPKPPMKAAAVIAARKIGSTNKILLDCLVAEAEKAGAPA